MPDGFWLRPGAKLGSDGRAADSHRARNGIATRARVAAWIVVATEYQADTDAARHLAKHGFDARQFLVRSYHSALGKRPAFLANEPAFPGYLIVRLHPTDPLHCLRADSRHGLAGWLHAVGAPDTPAVLPDLAMAVLLEMAAKNTWTGEDALLGQVDERGRLVPVPSLHAPAPDFSGLEVEIVDHPWLAGLRGTCLHSGRDRVVVLLSLLGTSRVEVDRDSVRPL